MIIRDAQQYVTMPTGLILPEHAAAQQIRKMRRPRAFDAFCGCGGSSLGTMQAGFEVVGALDLDPYASITYMHNLGAHPMKIHFTEDKHEKRLEAALKKEMTSKKGELLASAPISGTGWRKGHPEVPGVSHFWFADIKTITGKEILDTLGMKIGELDCLIGTPPCQGYSTAGNKNVMDPRNSLVFDWCRLVVEMQPKTTLFENVPGILNMVTPDGVPVVDAMARILEDGDFTTHDAFLKGIETQNGVKLLRGKGKKKSKKKAEPKQAQTDLFTEAAQ